MGWRSDIRLTDEGNGNGALDWASGVMVGECKGRVVLGRTFSILVVSRSPDPSKAFITGPQEKPIWLPDAGAWTWGEVGRRKVKFPIAEVEADSREDSKKAENAKPFEKDSSILVCSMGA